MARTRRMPAPPLRPRKNVRFEDVLARLDAHQRPYDPDLLAAAYNFAGNMHGDQVRRSGEPYVSHPLYVAYILADLKLDQTCVAVALLHDVLEDTRTTKQALEERFGTDVAELVDGVTKIGQQEYVRRDQAQAETFRKMILASARDLRVILVKLADRLHNMMTLEHMAADSRRRIASETLQIYAPIALRLGMSKLQGDLEDLAFYHRYPLQFAELHASVSDKMRGGRSQLKQLANQLAASLKEAEIEADISYRVKRYYSIYRKLRRQGIDFSQVFDYLAFRVITEDLKDTYAALGVVHQRWRFIPGRFKDYISMPKPNLYQSLHTTVIGDGGKPFEVQIRTREMDLIAEEGIAAHWQYKAGTEGADDPNIVWLRQLLEWQKEVQDPREFLSALKIDLYPEEVYIFTPKGDVYSFPRGATPLDFAYRIHTDLGHHCSGARVNGKLEPLKTPLKNGDMVEIMTATTRKPSRDWLSFVVTSRARSKIRHWLNTEQKQESQAIGRKLLERELKKLRVAPKKVFAATRTAEYLEREGLPRLEDLFERIGYGKTPLKQVLSGLLEEDLLKKEPVAEKPGPIQRVIDRALGTGPLLIKGQGDLMATLAKCCAPVPGEELVGFVTRGRGISVHSRACPNVKSLTFDPDRLVEVEWARQSTGVYPVALAIETENHTGMLARLTEVIAKESSNIRHIEAETSTGRGRVEMVIEVKNRRHLAKVRQAVAAVKGVLHVRRRRSGDRAELR